MLDEEHQSVARLLLPEDHLVSSADNKVYQPNESMYEPGCDQ